MPKVILADNTIHDEGDIQLKKVIRTDRKTRRIFTEAKGLSGGAFEAVNRLAKNWSIRTEKELIKLWGIRSKEGL
ncbi:MAG: hypothetical protein WA152_02680 [Microgenomates group bacterium]